MPIFEVVNRQSDVINNLMKMLELGSSNDITIVLSDGEVKANKDVLCASSDYFATMFSNAAFNECKNGIVPMKDVRKVVMEGLLKFLFSGVLDLKGFEIKDLLELMNLSRFMFLPNLFSDIELYLVSNLDKIRCPTHEFYEAFSLVYKFRLEGVKSSFMKEIKILHEIRGENDVDFLNFTSDMVYDVLKPSDEEDELSLQTKFKAYNFWYCYSSSKCTQEDKDKFLALFPLKKFSGKDLLEIVKKSNLYSDELIDGRLIEVMDKYEEEIRELQLKNQEEREKRMKLEGGKEKKKSSLQSLPIRRRSMVPHYSRGSSEVLLR